MRRLGFIRRAVLPGMGRLGRGFQVFHVERIVMAVSGIQLCHDS